MILPSEPETYKDEIKIVEPTPVSSLFNEIERINIFYLYLIARILSTIMLELFNVPHRRIEAILFDSVFLISIFITWNNKRKV